jgi:CRP-like cAMP-binding protein
MRRTRIDLGQLAGVPTLRGSSLETLTAIDGRVTELRMRPGRALCHQGRVANQLVVLLEGTADVTRGGEPVRQLGAGDVVGGAELRIRGRHDVTIITRSAVQALVMGAADLEDLRDAAPEAFSRLTGVWRPTPVAVPVRLGQPAPVRRPALGLLGA